MAQKFDTNPHPCSSPSLRQSESACKVRCCVNTFEFYWWSPVSRLLFASLPSWSRFAANFHCRKALRNCCRWCLGSEKQRCCRSGRWRSECGAANQVVDCREAQHNVATRCLAANRLPAGELWLYSVVWPLSCSWGNYYVKPSENEMKKKNLLFLNFCHQRLQNGFNLSCVVSLEQGSNVCREQCHESVNEKISWLRWSNNWYHLWQCRLVGCEGSTQLLQQRFSRLDICRRQTGIKSDRLRIAREA